MWYKHVFFQQTHLSNASQPYSFGRWKMIRMQKLQLWSLIFRLLGVFQRSRNTRPPELPKCGHTRLRQQPSFLICIVQTLIGHIQIFYWKGTYSVGLDPCFQTHVCVFRLFFFLSAWIVTLHEFIVQGTKNTVHGSRDTIHTFKNYFATMFLVFSFSKNNFRVLPCTGTF